MPELSLQRRDTILEVRLGELSATIPWDEIVPRPDFWQQIYADPAAYGRELFARTFPAEALQKLLTEMRARERLLLLVDDPSVAQIPWEYLRDSNNKLLAGRLTFVRSFSTLPASSIATPAGPLEIIAIPSSPIDETVPLNVEYEWRTLVKIVQSSARALTLKRLRPPTIGTLGMTLPRQGSSIVHFMGHGIRHQGQICLSFENFSALDASNQKIVNVGFLDYFYTQLAHFYKLEPVKYPTMPGLQQAILQQRAHQRSLLILDNIETLFDSLADPMAQECAAFLLRLKDGDGVVLL